jgi:hypothetical protein
MALEEFEKEELSDRENNLVRMRSLTNYVMGIFLLGAGCVFMFPMKSTRPYINQYDPAVIKIFAAVCMIYGIFRIYRGYKKNYFRN